jgi:hypothetical protein
MSEALVERAHIDALLTAAVTWGEETERFERFSFYREEPFGHSGVRSRRKGSRSGRTPTPSGSCGIYSK